MKTINLKLTAEQAEHISHLLAGAWENAAAACLAANKEGDKDEEYRQFRAAKAYDAVKGEIDTKAKKAFIGW